MKSFLSVILLLVGAALIILPGGCSLFFLVGSIPDAVHGRDLYGAFPIVLICSAVAAAIGTGGYFLARKALRELRGARD